MKKNMKTFCLAGAALVLAGTIFVESAMAYFTTYATAEGHVQMNLDFSKTVPKEDVSIEKSYAKKAIQIENTGNEDCYVRVKALAGDKYQLSYSEKNSQSMTVAQAKWKPGADGFYYYSDILRTTDPGNKTTTLYVQIPLENPVEGSNELPDDFNVIVIQESTPVPYDDNGNPKPADWSVKAYIVQIPVNNIQTDANSQDDAS